MSVKRKNSGGQRRTRQQQRIRRCRLTYQTLLLQTSKILQNGLLRSDERTHGRDDT